MDIAAAATASRGREEPSRPRTAPPAAGEEPRQPSTALAAAFVLHRDRHRPIACARSGPPPSAHPRGDPTTSFRPGEALVQVKDDFLHKVLNVAVLRPSDKHHPVVGEALHGGFLPDLGSVSQLQLHLDGTLRGKRRGAAGERPSKRRWGWRPGGTERTAGGAGTHGHSRTINTAGRIWWMRAGKPARHRCNNKKTAPQARACDSSGCHRQSAGWPPGARCQGRSALPGAPRRSLPALRRRRDRGSLRVRACAAGSGRQGKPHANRNPRSRQPLPDGAGQRGAEGRRRPAVLTHRAGHAWGAGSAGALAAVPHPHRAALIHEDVEEMAGAQRSGEQAAGILRSAARAGCGGDCRPGLAARAPRAPAARAPAPRPRLPQRSPQPRRPAQRPPRMRTARRADTGRGTQ